MLDEKTSKELKARLQENEKKLTEELQELGVNEEGDLQMDDYGDSEEENAEEVSNYYSKVDVAETLKAKLNDVKDALERMEKGTYGQCTNCDNEEIPIERLRANPSAKSCIQCKSQQQ